MTVVRLVRKTGCMLMCMLSISASLRAMPRRIALNIEIRMCTLAAIASVMITVGAPTDDGVSMIPIQPAIPIAVTAERRMMPIVPITPANERSITTIMTSKMPYMRGVRFSMSAMLASAKAAFSMTSPVM